MTSVSTELVNSMLPSRLRERLATLHVTVVGLCADGKVVAHDGASKLERLVLASSQFAVAVHKEYDALHETPVRAVEIWPEVYLSALPSRRRRRVVVQPNEPHFLAAMFIGPGFLSSDQLHRLCDANQLDFQAVVTQAAQAHPCNLVSPSEAQRLSGMITWMQQDSQELERRDGEVHSMSRQLGDTYEELSLLYKLSTNMTVDQPPEYFLTEVCREM